MRHTLNTHRSGATGDPNHRLQIIAIDGPDGPPFVDFQFQADVYDGIQASQWVPLSFGLHMPKSGGMTDEALLAIVQSRLNNPMADRAARRIALASVSAALEALKMDRHEQAKERAVPESESNAAPAVAGAARPPGEDEEPAPAGSAGEEVPASEGTTAGRVTVAHDWVAIRLDATGGAGPVMLPLLPLATTWKAWSELESKLRRLQPPIADAELDLLGRIPTNHAASNGLAELRSALSRR